MRRSLIKLSISIFFITIRNTYGTHYLLIKGYEKELRNIIHTHPNKISPNVVLRPLYQQTILPNLAYVGGPGELAYWLQFKKMFDDLNESLLVKNLLFSKEAALKALHEANRVGTLKKQLLQDKKAAGKNQVNFVFLRGPGRPKVITIPNESLLQFAVSQEMKEN